VDPKIKRNRLMQYKYKILDEELIKSIMLNILENDDTRTTHDVKWVADKQEKVKKKPTKVVISPEIKKVTTPE
jgi:hypothetical protein